MATEILSRGWDEPYYVVRTSAFDAFFLVGEEDPDEVANVDFRVQYPDSARWGATMFTLDEVDRLMRRWERTGEYADGRYFPVSRDLIVREPGVAKMAAVLIAMHDSDDLTSVLERYGTA
ncbi:hypothetical protein [Amycolatopsis sp. WGS_07]|uniref:hypothetical protein n=1 Tax=Amycolatopsis sp. WGS_07 TaxID=3076764 RepID=UPI0038738C9A